jgi:hypothetical protein
LKSVLTQFDIVSRILGAIGIKNGDGESSAAAHFSLFLGNLQDPGMRRIHPNGVEGESRKASLILSK